MSDKTQYKLSNKLKENSNENTTQSKSSINWVSVIIAVIFLSIAVYGANYFNNNRPQAKKQDSANGSQQQANLLVEVLDLEITDYQAKINVFGQVEAVTQGQLVSQVSGEIIAVDEKSSEGAVFQKGDELIRIDDRDYQISLTSANAMLASAKSNLLQEQARSEQAAIDWQRLGNGEKANDLVLRKPQLLSAESDVESANSNIKQAELDITRTKIIAPYEGQVISRMVDLGQYVNQGTPLLEIYALDVAEVKLPLNSRQLSLMELTNPTQHKVTITTQYGDDEYQWQAKIVRTAAQFDEQSRQLEAIAQIDNPFIATGNQPPLKIGQFIKAEILGKVFKNVYVIPTENVYQNSYILAVDNEKLIKNDVKIIFQDNETTVVTSDSNLDNIVVTALGGSAQTGMSVRIKGQVINNDDVINNEAISNDNNNTREKTI